MLHLFLGPVVALSSQGMQGTLSFNTLGLALGAIEKWLIFALSLQIPTLSKVPIFAVIKS